jgi:hypothetical protein
MWILFISRILQTQDTATTPEPATLAMLGAGAAVFGFLAWRKRKK